MNFCVPPQIESEGEKWDWQTILYIVEDLLGGSMAISNIVMRLLGHILQNPHVLNALRAEVSPVSPSHPLMTYCIFILYILHDVFSFGLA